MARKGTALILTVMCLATFMAILDTSLVNLGLKSIQQNLGADTATLQWVLCHEYRRSKRRCATVREMKEGPSRSAIRC
jgi:hypothetical protein